jgi:hypothetical protein
MLVLIVSGSSGLGVCDDGILDRIVTGSFLCSEFLMPSIDFQQVRSIISVGEVLDLLSFVAVTRRGSQVRGACPLHESGAAKSRVFSAHWQ